MSEDNITYIPSPNRRPANDKPNFIITCPKCLSNNTALKSGVANADHGRRQILLLFRCESCQYTTTMSRYTGYDKRSAEEVEETLSTEEDS